MRTVVITGSASGIGRMARQLFIARGWRAIGVDRAEDADIMVDLGAAAGRAALVAQVTAMCDGKLDAVIACAGLAARNPQIVPVNYFGALATLAGLRPLLLRGESPRAVAVSSTASMHHVAPDIVDACLAGDEAAALAACRGQEHLMYASSKAALTRWVRRVASSPEWAGSGILLNAIAPGTVRTPMTAPLLATAEGQALLQNATPLALADYADPEDIAELLAFLVSPQLRYVVGQVIYIDGGGEALQRGDATW